MIKKIAIGLLIAGTLITAYNYFIVQPNGCDLERVIFLNNQGLFAQADTCMEHIGVSNWCGILGTTILALAFLAGLMTFSKLKQKSGLIIAGVSLAIGICGFLMSFHEVI